MNHWLWLKGKKKVKWSWIKAEQDNQNNIQWVEKDIVAESKVFSGTNKITEGWLKLSNKL